MDGVRGRARGRGRGRGAVQQIEPRRPGLVDAPVQVGSHAAVMHMLKAVI
jgi:hypothetical protein